MCESNTGPLQIPSNAYQDLCSMYNLDGPVRMEEAIELLEKWIKQENHLLKKDFHRGYLERALLVNKGSVEMTKRRIDALCTIKTLTPHFYTINSTKEEFLEVLNIMNVVPLPVMTKDLYRIILLTIKDNNFTQHQFLLVLQYSILLVEYLCRHDYINGIIFANDFRLLNLFDVLKKVEVMTELRQCVTIAIKGYGMRIKGCHIVSESKTADFFSTVVKQFVSQKILERTSVYKSFEDIYDKILPRDNFPEDYGGKERPLKELTKAWVETLFSEENMEYFKLMSEARTDESLRSSGKFNSEYLGMPGSFRHLSVD